MSQRASGFARREAEDYPTPAWVAAVVAQELHLMNVMNVWEPAAGEGKLARALERDGFRVTATTDNFLARNLPPSRDLDAICTNPPYGGDGRGEFACRFIRHALSMPVRVVAMLLRADFDSGKTRVDMFRDNRRFSGKITLLDRIKWFPGGSSPSDNHAWFLWDGIHNLRTRPTIRYAVNPEKAQP